MKKQLTAILAVSLAVLSACAVEGHVPDDQLDDDVIETTEQAYGEAACETTTISSPGGGAWTATVPSCATLVSASGLYSNPGCTSSFMAQASNITAPKTSASAVISYVDPISATNMTRAICESHKVRATVYRNGLPTLTFPPQPALYLPASNDCLRPSITTGTFALSGSYRVVAQAYVSGFPISPMKVAIQHGYTCP